MVFERHLCEKVWASHSLSNTTAVISTILCVITVPGNLLIVVSMAIDPHRQLKSSFNYFVVNLAFADLIIGCVTEPAFIGFHIRQSLSFPVAGTVWVLHLAYFIACTASLLSLSALTIDRYLSVTSMYKRDVRASKVFILSAGIWFVSVSFPMLYFAVGFYTFAFIFANTAVVASLVIVSFAYVRVYQKLRAQVLRWGSYRQRQMLNKAIIFERKLTKSFLIILAFFTFCLLPSCLMNYVISLCESCDCSTVHWLRDLQFLFTLVNCSSNQFLYAMRSHDFRRAFVTILRLRSVTCLKEILDKREMKIALKSLGSREYVYTHDGEKHGDTDVSHSECKRKLSLVNLTGREEVLLPDTGSEIVSDDEISKPQFDDNSNFCSGRDGLERSLFQGLSTREEVFLKNPSDI
ncbi:octopamine receptor beta-2R [Nematostella vectensis]|uniref:octopamine receptor beta-2R n=1 Tax=Nematostella vectensis TaxID=45351 RepID=UPI002076F19E|nr:octopamine receptor beta-2R [Nematostella vectensis]XP_032234799.2 octopamine receptor beta-2R [Nematostella vectensis]XP_048579051.1 octopamine receptor beta-2R [Nematostella vectensis]